ARFAEHGALANELKGLEEAAAAAKQTLAKAEREQKGRGPRLTILSQPSQPERPVRPDYWRDALIATVGSALLGMMAVWFVEFFKRSGVTPPEPVASQPIIQIAYPPNIMLNQGAPALELPAQRVPETLAAPAARELSALEVGALWSAAVPDTRVIIAGLLNG